MERSTPPPTSLATPSNERRHSPLRSILAVRTKSVYSKRTAQRVPTCISTTIANSLLSFGLRETVSRQPQQEVLAAEKVEEDKGEDEDEDEEKEEWEADLEEEETDEDENIMARINSTRKSGKTPKSDPATMSPPITPAGSLTSGGMSSDLEYGLSGDRGSGRQGPLAPGVRAHGKQRHNKSRTGRARSTASYEDLPYSNLIPPRPVPGIFELRGDTSRGYTEYGRGTWSIVYQALYRESPGGQGGVSADPNLPSPPESPHGPLPTRGGDARIVAVKVPIPQAIENPRPVLEKEARILSFIQPLQGPRAAHACQFLAPFLGFEASTSSLVFDALPLTLAAFSQQRARSIRDDFSTKSMLEPMVGPRQWLRFADRLIAGLEYLHNNSVIHGDIKPTNILLRMAGYASDSDVGAVAEEFDTFTGSTLFDPVYCDFSSARVEQVDAIPDEVSAVTTPYTAPELLEAFYHRNSERAIATFATDVFGLAATLIVPATGEELYHSVSNHIQKLTLARHGQPLEHARNSEQASRVIQGKFVDTVLVGALAKEADKRWSVREWKDILHRCVAG